MQGIHEPCAVAFQQRNAHIPVRRKLSAFRLAHAQQGLLSHISLNRVDG